MLVFGESALNENEPVHLLRENVIAQRDQARRGGRAVFIPCDNVREVRRIHLRAFKPGDRRYVVFIEAVSRYQPQIHKLRAVKIVIDGIAHIGSRRLYSGKKSNADSHNAEYGKEAAEC